MESIGLPQSEKPALEFLHFLIGEVKGQGALGLSGMHLQDGEARDRYGLLGGRVGTRNGLPRQRRFPST
jgi:hypothetical protein